MVTTRNRSQNGRQGRNQAMEDTTSSSLGSTSTTADVLKEKTLGSSLNSSSHPLSSENNNSTQIYRHSAQGPGNGPGYPVQFFPVYSHGSLPMAPMYFYAPNCPFPQSNYASGGSGANGGSGGSDPLDVSNSNTGTSSNNTDESSTSSDSSGEWNPTYGMILHTAVAAYATFAECDPVTGEVDIEKLNWDRISQHFPDHTSVGCYRYWKSLNPETSLLRTANGIVYKHANVPTPPSNSNSSVPVEIRASNAGSGSGSGLNSSSNGNLGSGESTKTTSDETSRPSKRRRRKKEKVPWTKEEEDQIDELQQELGNKWTKIAERLNTGRSGNDVKNYWHSVKDKIIENRFKRKNDEMDIAGEESGATSSKKQRI